DAEAASRTARQAWRRSYRTAAGDRGGAAAHKVQHQEDRPTNDNDDEQPATPAVIGRRRAGGGRLGLGLPHHRVELSKLLRYRRVALRLAVCLGAPLGITGIISVVVEIGDSLRPR